MSQDNPKTPENSDEETASGPVDAASAAVAADKVAREAGAQSAPTETPEGSKPAAPKPSSMKPRAPKPSAVRAAPAKVGEASAVDTPAAPAPVEVPVDKLAERGREHGRVDDDNTVFVTDGDTERNIGSYPGASTDEALAYFVRKYDELTASIDILAARLSAPTPALKEIAASLDALDASLVEPMVLGDIPALRERAATIRETYAARKEQVDAERAKAREQARGEREKIVEAAEQIAAKDPSKVQWKQSGERIKELFEQWRSHQQRGPRLDKKTEDELWKRFRAARSSFEKQRKAHFAALDAERDEVKALKEKLIAEAEKLSSSTEWGATAGAFKRLMSDWKQAGRAGRKDDDSLWERFKSAQDRFFETRNEVLAEQDKEFEGNLAVKEKLLERAEALLPITDVKRAKNELRKIGDEWDAAGKVPRKDMARVEGRLKAVEQAVRDADDQQWRAKNPEGKARAEGVLGQLQASIAGLERDLEAAKADGNAKAIADAEEALKARRAWLAQIEKAHSDFS